MACLKTKPTGGSHLGWGRGRGDGPGTLEEDEKNQVLQELRLSLDLICKPGNSLFELCLLSLTTKWDSTFVVSPAASQ
jgi:hypothetical protein